MSDTQAFSGTAEEKQVVLERIRARVREALADEDTAAATPKNTDTDERGERQTAPLPIADFADILSPGDPVHVPDDLPTGQWHLTDVVPDDAADDDLTTENSQPKVSRKEATDSQMLDWAQVLPPREATAFEATLNRLIALYDDAKATGDSAVAGYYAELLEQYVAFAENDAYISGK